jgi:plasmid stabilization system protein ParE
MNFKFLPPARAELHAAARYYEQCVPGLGFEFLLEIRAAIRRMIDFPEAWQILDDRIRRCRTHTFPYGLIYTFDNGDILILSVMHLHRHPGSWRQNLQ